MRSITAILGSTALAFAAVPVPAPAGVSLDSIHIEDPRPADAYRTDRYTCAGEDDRTTDVIIEYGVTAVSPTEHQSRVHRIRIGDRELTSAELDEINDFASAGTVQGSSVACWSNGIRVAIEVFDPDSIEPGQCLTDASVFLQIHFVRETGELKLP